MNTNSTLLKSPDELIDVSFLYEGERERERITCTELIKNT